MTYDYSENDIILALKKSGIRKNDLVFCHSDISLFGIPKCNISKQGVSSLFLRSFFKVLGSGGTLIIPTFTYSFPNKKMLSGKHLEPELIGNLAKIGNFKSVILTHLNPQIDKSKKSIIKTIQNIADCKVSFANDFQKISL